MTWHRDFRDHLRWRIAADTLFLIGSRTAFELLASQVRSFAEESPAQLAVNPEHHCCEGIDIGRQFRHDRRSSSCRLHIESCRAHW